MMADGSEMKMRRMERRDRCSELALFSCLFMMEGRGTMTKPSYCLNG